MSPAPNRRPTHYQTLGVGPTASAEQIRAAYRAAARRAHPDRWASSPTRNGAAATMAEINEAYRVLGHPARRASYDDGLRTGESAGGGDRPGNTGHATAGPTPAGSRSWLARVLSPPGPARYPVRLVLVAALVSSVVMVLYSSQSGPVPDGGVDGVIETGSCVTLNQSEQVTESECTGAGTDLVVTALVPLGQTCRDGQPGYIDRNGLAVICIENRRGAP